MAKHLLKLFVFIFTFLAFTSVVTKNASAQNFICEVQASTDSCVLNNTSFLGCDSNVYDFDAARAFCSSRSYPSGCQNPDTDNLFFREYPCTVLGALSPTPTSATSPTPIPPDYCFSRPASGCGAFQACSDLATCCYDDRYCPAVTPTPMGSPCATNSQCIADYNGDDGSTAGEFNNWSNCTHVAGNTYCNQQPPDPLCDDNVSINTAIGCIPVANTTEFAGWILGWGMGVAGGIAFLLIIYAGFLIMSSEGNPQRLTAGKELLTAAIAGIILLIFSAFILRAIGVNILGIFPQ